MMLHIAIDQSEGNTLKSVSDVVEGMDCDILLNSLMKNAYKDKTTEKLISPFQKLVRNSNAKVT